jgi:hypothetical protein
VALLSQSLAAPREGHLEEVFHVFAYLKAHDRSSLVFDPRPFENDPSRFTQPDWSEFYPGAAEAIPPNMPEPRENEGVVTCYVDADHAGCRVTRRDTVVLTTSSSDMVFKTPEHCGGIYFWI